MPRPAAVRQCLPIHESPVSQSSQVTGSVSFDRVEILGRHNPKRANRRKRFDVSAVEAGSAASFIDSAAPLGAVEVKMAAKELIAARATGGPRLGLALRFAIGSVLANVVD